MSVKPIDKSPPPFAQEIIPPATLQPTQISHETSTLAKASPIDSPYRPSKPSLDPPVNPIYQTLDQLNHRTETIYDKWLQMKEDQIEKSFKDIQALHVEQARQMDIALETSKKVSFWGYLEDFSNTVSASMAFYFGSTAALSGNPIAGGALIASGVFSIGNLAFKHNQLWDWVANQIAGSDKDLKEKVQTYLPTALGLAATALTMGVSYSTWRYPSQTGMQMTSSLINTTADILDGIVKYKSNTTSAEHKWKLADLNILQTTADLSRIELENAIEDVQEFHEHQTDMHMTIGKILEEQDQAIQIVQQPV